MIVVDTMGREVMIRFLGTGKEFRWQPGDWRKVGKIGPVDGGHLD
jgi:hypothetical protein